MHDPQSDNPYAAPQTRSDEVVSRRDHDADLAVKGWIVVFFLNLPLPVVFGMGATAGGWQSGMVFGCVAVLVIGLVLCFRVPRLMIGIWIGGLLVALSQFMPMLQIWVGGFSIQIAQIISGSSNPRPDHLHGLGEITLATILTGLGLILPSLMIGWTIMALDRAMRAH